MEAKLQLSVVLLLLQGTLAMRTQVTLMKGETLRLRCPISNAHRSPVEWKNPEGFLMFFNHNKALKDKRYSITQLSESRFSISVSNVRLEDGGNYTCTHYGHTPIERKVEVTVISGPRLSVTRHAGRLQIKCSAQANTSPPLLSWELHGTEFSTAATCFRRQKKKYQSESMINLPALQGRLTVHCLLRHPALNSQPLMNFVTVGRDTSSSSTSAPAQTSTSAPPQTSTSAPPKSSTSAPAQTSTSAPAQTSTSAPPQTSTSAPAQTSPSAPAQTSTSAPPQTSTSAPAQTSPSAPPQTSTSAPPQTSTSAPPQTSTSAPPKSSTSAPAQTSTSAPAQTSTSAPPQTSTSAPAQTSTSASPQTSTSAPAQTSTSAPPQRSNGQAAEGGETATPFSDPASTQPQPPTRPSDPPLSGPSHLSTREGWASESETTEHIPTSNSTKGNHTGSSNSNQQVGVRRNSWLLVFLVTCLMVGLLVVVLFLAVKLRKAHIAWRKENDDCDPSEDSSKSKSSQEEKNIQRRRGLLNTTFAQYVVQEPTVLVPELQAAAPSGDQHLSSYPEAAAQTVTRPDAKETSL